MTTYDLSSSNPNYTDNNSGDTFILESSNTTYTINGSGSDETISEAAGISGVTLNIANNGDIVTLTGSSETLNVNGTGIAFYNDAVGGEDSINMAANATATINGNGNSIGLTTNGGVSITGGTSSAPNYVNNNSAAGNNSVFIYANSNVVFEGTAGGGFDVNGTGITVAASGYGVGAIAGSTFTLNGGGDDVATAANVTETINGNNDWIGLLTGDAISITGGTSSAPNYVNNNSAAGNNSVFIYANSNVVFEGTAGGGFDVNGTGITVAASGYGVGAIAGSTFTLNGGGDDVATAANVTETINGNNDWIGLLTGDAISITGGTSSAPNYVNNNSAAGNNSVFIYANSNVVFEGTAGGGFDVNGTGITVAASGYGVGAIAGSTFTLNGGSDDVDMAAGVTATINGNGNWTGSSAGAGDVVYVNGNGNWITGSSQYTAYFENGSTGNYANGTQYNGQTVYLASNDGVSVTGDECNIFSNSAAGTQNIITAYNSWTFGNTINLTKGYGNDVVHVNSSSTLNNGFYTLVEAGQGNDTIDHDSGAGAVVFEWLAGDVTFNNFHIHDLGNGNYNCIDSMMGNAPPNLNYEYFDSTGYETQGFCSTNQAHTSVEEIITSIPAGHNTPVNTIFINFDRV